MRIAYTMVMLLSTFVLAESVDVDKAPVAISDSVSFHREEYYDLFNERFKQIETKFATFRSETRAWQRSLLSTLPKSFLTQFSKILSGVDANEGILQLFRDSNTMK